MIELKNISKEYKDGQYSQVVINDINLRIDDSDFITIQGESGGGKSTLLNIISLLTQPSDGSIFYDGVKLNLNKEREIEEVRRRKVGLVFQSPNLITCLNPLENILLAAGTSTKKEAERYALELLERVGLKTKDKVKVRTLSGGEAQRVAIVRALVNKPKIILCDEPTGALDQKTSTKVIELLTEIRESEKCAMIIVTHDKKIAQLGNRKLFLEGGKAIEMA